MYHSGPVADAIARTAASRRSSGSCPRDRRPRRPHQAGSDCKLRIPPPHKAVGLFGFVFRLAFHSLVCCWFLDGFLLVSVWCCFKTKMGYPKQRHTQPSWSAAKRKVPLFCLVASPSHMIDLERHGSNQSSTERVTGQPGSTRRQSCRRKAELPRGKTSFRNFI